MNATDLPLVLGFAAAAVLAWLFGAPAKWRDGALGSYRGQRMPPPSAVLPMLMAAALFAGVLFLAWRKLGAAP